MHDNLYMCMSATSNDGVCHTEIGLSINVFVVHLSYSSITVPTHNHSNINSPKLQLFVHTGVILII